VSIRYFHGGVPGLRSGDLLLPPAATGTARALTTELGHLGTFARSDRVYLTTDRAAARAFAACYPDGALYVVEPVGDVEPDPDAPKVSIRCGQAVVTSVYDPVVRYADRGERWLNALTRGAR
jgi:hypothetical protein